MSAAAMSEWQRIVDEVATGEEDDLTAVNATYTPAIPAAVLEESRQRFANPGYVPLLSAGDAFRAKPAKAHQTDALLPSEAAEKHQVNFLDMVTRIATTTAVVVPPEAPRFDPIIIVPEQPTAIVQKCNVRRFLEDGQFVAADMLRRQGDPLATSLVHSREASVFVEPKGYSGLPNVRVTFRRFRVVSDIKQIENWDHVAAVFVTGHAWQFEGWRGAPGSENATSAHSPADPAHLFASIRGYFPYFEESRLPAVIKQWRIVPLLLTHKETKAHSSVRVAAQFWEDLYAHLDSHPFFRRFALEPIPGDN